MWERCRYPTRAGTPDLGNKRLTMAECLEDFIIRILVSESVLLKHIDRAWVMDRKVSKDMTSLVVQWSESLPTNHEVPGSIPGSTMGIFPEGEDSRGDHGLGRLVEFRFKGPLGTTSSYITTHIIGAT